MYWKVLKFCIVLYAVQVLLPLQLITYLYPGKSLCIH